jgi:hypothetical protein
MQSAPTVAVRELASITMSSARTSAYAREMAWLWLEKTTAVPAMANNT